MDGTGAFGGNAGDYGGGDVSTPRDREAFAQALRDAGLDPAAVITPGTRGWGDDVGTGAAPAMGTMAAQGGGRVAPPSLFPGGGGPHRAQRLAPSQRHKSGTIKRGGGSAICKRRSRIPYNCGVRRCSSNTRPWAKLASHWLGRAMGLAQGHPWGWAA